MSGTIAGGWVYASYVEPCEVDLVKGRVSVKREWNSHGVTEGTERMRREEGTPGWR